jgi:hypothetical protein
VPSYGLPNASLILGPGDQADLHLFEVATMWLAHFPIRSHQPTPRPNHHPRVPLMGGWAGDWAGAAGPRKRKNG